MNEKESHRSQRVGYGTRPRSVLNSLLVPVVACLLLVGSLEAAQFDHSHALFGQVLEQFVKQALVDYAGLTANPTALHGYLEQLEEVSAEEFGKWTENQQLAFLINLYNAATLRRVIERYPVRSIQAFGGTRSGASNQSALRIFGRKVSLRDLEQRMIRNDFNEPACHFALAGATRSGPELRGEAYVADRLRDQFIDQGRRFFSAPGRNSVDLKKRIVYLSPIFKWYKEDFIKKSGSVLEFVQFYVSPELSDELSQGGFRIRYTRHDGSLNDLQPEKK